MENNEIERLHLNFQNIVRSHFEFLEKIGFIEIEAKSTTVRYRKGSVELYVYHDLISYEVGLLVHYDGKRYSIESIIDSADHVVVDKFRNQVARTRIALNPIVERLADLMRQYGSRAIEGDRSFFIDIDKQKKLMRQAYVRDLQASQIKPKAEAAFREGKYGEAARLFELIELSCLSRAERAKFALAKKRAL